MSTTDRNGLTSRPPIPEMLLSSGTSTSLTAPPPPIPHYLDASGRAAYRFAVEGNALITGGAGTLGLEAARALLEHGLAGLALFDVNPAQSITEIERLMGDFPAAKIEVYKVDVTDAKRVEEAVGEAQRDLKSIDMLCCFAGVVGCEHAIDLAAEAWRKVLDINTSGAFFVAQAVARVMRTQQTGGSIVFIASISAHIVNYPQPHSAYNASKAALLHLKSCLAAEWARYGIRVNSISPGYMDTILNEGEGLAQAREVWAARNPMGRMGVPQELCGPLVLLCSNAGSYINGADIIVDGGATVF